MLAESSPRGRSVGWLICAAATLSTVLPVDRLPRRAAILAVAIALLSCYDFDRSTATALLHRPFVVSLVSQPDAMPHASDSQRIEVPFGATDEVKVYKDEGEDEKPENLSEEKFGLVTETEEVKLKAG